MLNLMGELLRKLHFQISKYPDSGAVSQGLCFIYHQEPSYICITMNATRQESTSIVNVHAADVLCEALSVS